MRRERRAEPRIDVLLHGTLSVGGGSQRCVILNTCSRGFLIYAQKGLELGHTVELRIELHPNVFITCIVDARHVNAGRIGAFRARDVGAGPAALAKIPGRSTRVDRAGRVAASTLRALRE